jgi:hypothetical protein
VVTFALKKSITAPFLKHQLRSKRETKMYQLMKSILVATASIMLISCASYSLKPHYDEQTKTVNLGTYPVNTITFHNSESKRVGEANAVKII